jgi:hypothetical protein
MNLVSINAAYQLGCRALPPVGAVVRWKLWKFYPYLCDGTVLVHSHNERLEAHLIVWRHAAKDRWLVSPLMPKFCVISLPDDAPPFEEWP